MRNVFSTLAAITGGSAAIEEVDAIVAAIVEQCVVLASEPVKDPWDARHGIVVETGGLRGQPGFRSSADASPTLGLPSQTGPRQTTLTDKAQPTSLTDRALFIIGRNLGSDVTLAGIANNCDGRDFTWRMPLVNPQAAR